MVTKNKRKTPQRTNPDHKSLRQPGFSIREEPRDKVHFQETKWNGSVGSVGRAINRFVMYVEAFHGPVRAMKLDSYNFGIVGSRTYTPLLPARQRELAWRYVSY